MGVFSTTLQLRNTVADEVKAARQSGIITTLSDGDTIVIFNPANGKALSTEYTGFYNQGTDVKLADGKLTGYTKKDIWTVGVNADGTYTFSTADGDKLSMDTSYTSTPLNKVNDTWKVVPAKTADCFYVDNATRTDNYRLQWFARKNNWSAYTGTGPNFEVQFYLVTDSGEEPSGGLPAAGAQVVLYNQSAKAVLASQIGTAESPSIGKAAATVDGGKATCANGAVVFTVEKNGEYYRFKNEAYGYLCSNGTGNNAFYSRTASNDADWKVRTCSGGVGGFELESRTAKFNNTHSQWLEYYADSFKSYSMYSKDGKLDYTIYSFYFYPVADGTALTKGVVNLPAVVINTVPDAFVDTDYTLAFTVDAPFGVEGAMTAKLGGTALTYLLTRNVTKMLSVLMVDFSCALKLAIPIAVLSAMRESSGHHISVKGGRFLEAVAKADTIVFDKTGTLTYATPTVAAVIPFGGHDEAEMLRLAACLEEHYPHSMANAVVAEAKRHGLTHEEYHSQVQYVVAHGISSMVEGKKVIIGSAHFVFEDEGCRIPAGEQPKFDALPAAYSHLYLCIDGELAAVICIHDPLRREAREAVRALHESGFANVVMMTGDNRRTAEAVAAEVGVDAVYAEVLPEDKAAFIRQEKAKGHTVIMVGDGVNDSPALSQADAGIAISTGAAIAREIADITVSSEDLFALVTLRRLGEALMERIHGSYRFIVGFNLTLIVLGVAGVLPPTTSALLHNGSTLGISLRNMTDLLDENKS